MCLGTRFNRETEKRMIAALPDGLIPVYRTVTRPYNRAFHAVFSFYTYYAGMNRNQPCRSDGRALISEYKPGFHSFRAMSMALRSEIRSRRTTYVIKAHIRKEWITAIGKTDGAVIYVTNRVFSPSCRDESAIVGRP